MREIQQYDLYHDIALLHYYRKMIIPDSQGFDWHDNLIIALSMTSDSHGSRQGYRTNIPVLDCRVT
jgi:hypothetical protein